MYRINLLPHSLAATFCWLVVTTAYSDSPAELVPDRSSVDYMTQIKPILSEKCYSCHGSLRQESGLRLETVDLMLAGGDSGPVVSPGHPAESMLLRRVHGQMVNACRRLAKLPEANQVKLIETWILEGCKTPAETVPPKPADHWAFQKLDFQKHSLHNSGQIKSLQREIIRSMNCFPANAPRQDWIPFHRRPEKL